MRGLTGLKWSKNNWKATELACVNVKQEKITFKKSLLIKMYDFLSANGNQFGNLSPTCTYMLKES